MTEYSLSPSGEKVPLPAAEDYAAEYQRLERLAAEARAGRHGGRGRHGAGLRRRGDGRHRRGLDRRGRQADQVRHRLPAPQHPQLLEDRRSSTGASPRSRRRTPRSTRSIARCVLEKKTLTATYDSDCLKLADCVVVDVQCDYAKQELGNMRTGQTDMAALEATLRTIGERIPEHCLVLIETTVAPGTTEFVAWPILKKAFAARGLQQHAPARPQLRTRDAGPRVRRQHPRLLACVQRLHRGGARPRRELPEGRAEHGGVRAHRHGPADRVRDDEDRRELLSRDDPRVPQRVEHLRGAERRRPAQGRSTPSRSARRTTT